MSVQDKTNTYRGDINGKCGLLNTGRVCSHWILYLDNFRHYRSSLIFGMHTRQLKPVTVIDLGLTSSPQCQEPTGGPIEAIFYIGWSKENLMNLFSAVFCDFSINSFLQTKTARKF